MGKDFFADHRTNGIVIGVLVVLFISVIYFPKSIWDYEDELRAESQTRMITVGGAERLHYQLTKQFTTDTEQLVTVVNGVRDSLLAAAADTNYSYWGAQQIALPGKSVSVNYTDEYQQYYEAEHLKLFKLLDPHHDMDAHSVAHFLDSIRTLFNGGNYVGEQSMEIDSISLTFNVSDKYDILYQNIKTSMFNALTGSYTKYPEFSNPLVDAVMDSLEKNPELGGRVAFEGIYDGSVRVDFIIPFKFEENLEKTKLALKKQFAIDSYDSATYGDTLYEMAVEEFMIQYDTLETMPEGFVLMYSDTSEEVIEIPVEVKYDDMATALDNRRNTLYKMLTGYDEPSTFIADEVIRVALDSLGSPNAGIDSIHLDIDLSEAPFPINVRRNLSEYYHSVSLDQAYYKTSANLSDLDWNKAAVEVVEFIADTLRKKSDFSKWQIVEGVTDTFHVNVIDDFLRLYDNMNMRLYEKLTGEFTNIFDYAFSIVNEAQHLANVDTLNWSGSQVIEVMPDTILVDVFPKYMEEYSSTFIIPRDTVVRVDDSTFNGVWYREKIGVTQEFSLDSLDFLIPGMNSTYTYTFSGTDSVRSLNILQKADSARVEKVFFRGDRYVMIFNQDSVMENLYQITDMMAAFDSIQIDSIDVVSDEFVAGIQEKDLFMSKDSFGGWQDTIISKKYVKQQLFSHYLLTPEHTRCTVTNLPFRVTVRNNVNLAIESPITKPIKKSRYLFFSQTDSSHGSIVDGDMSWTK